jgi:deoxyribodipyrimidine photo-lyase
LSDNPAVANACRYPQKILPIYILDELTCPLGGAQRWWLHHSLIALQVELQKMNLNLSLCQGNALEVLTQLVKTYAIDTVYWNRCYEPEVIVRDTLIKQTLHNMGIKVLSSNGSLLHEPWQIANASGHFFKVFTPFWRACLKQMIIPAENKCLYMPEALAAKSDSLDNWNLLPKKPNWAERFEFLWRPGEAGAQEKLVDFIQQGLKGYDISRDNPAENATSKLSPHLHFGEISPWQIWRAIETVNRNKNYDLKSIDRFLAEIGWREFSYHLLYHFPTLPKENFKSAFNVFPWQNQASLLKCWQKGRTGYPIVDAGMRELWHTGYMHNRVRMIVASFLTKDLFIDWRLGARWFMDTLLDADVASNSASWQWVAGCGADAAPYFRIFNPTLQGEKFDPEGLYIKRWVPELKQVSVQWIHKPWMAPDGRLGLCLDTDYPKPIVDHAMARQQALLFYKMIAKK